MVCQRLAMQGVPAVAHVGCATAAHVRFAMTALATMVGMPLGKVTLVWSHNLGIVVPLRQRKCLLVNRKDWLFN